MSDLLSNIGGYASLLFPLLIFADLFDDVQMYVVSEILATQSEEDRQDLFQSIQKDNIDHKEATYSAKDLKFGCCSRLKYKIKYILPSCCKKCCGRESKKEALLQEAVKRAKIMFSISSIVKNFSTTDAISK